MRLTINGEEVSYSLEHERTLGEVVHGVRAWLATAGFVISGLEADGSDILNAPAETWGARAVTDVTTLAVSAAHTGDMRIAHWRSVQRWLEMLAGELGHVAAGAPEVEIAALDVLLDDLPHTMDGFAANPFVPPGSDAVKRFATVLEGARAAQVREWPLERLRAAEEVARELTAFVQARLDDATHPAEALARRVGQLQSSLGDIREVSVLLQTGKDRQAMETVIRFADLAQSIMNLFPFLPPDPARGRLFTELTPVLRELVGAFDAKDSVLIGDLLEYEVAPRVEKLAPLLGRSE